MELTDELKDILTNPKFETMGRVLDTMVKYGTLFNAEKMVPISSKYNHLVTSFGLKALAPVYDLLDRILDAGEKSSQPFTVDPRPIDDNVPAGALEKLVSKKFMYTNQDSYEEQLRKLGLKDDNAFTCTCYMDEVGNAPTKGEILSWAESSAVVYANSVLGARCNRNSGIIDIMGSIVGYVPYFGLLTDEGRKATWKIEVKTTKKPEAQLLGSAIGMKVMEDVPYIVGLDKWLGSDLNEEVRTYLKDFGAATASNGAVGLYHVENLTPEAVEQGQDLLVKNYKTFVVDDKVLEDTYKNYPIMWKNKNARPKLCFMGCPHFSLEQLHSWTEKLDKGLAANGNTKVQVPTVFTAAPDVIEQFKKTDDYMKLTGFGVIISYICPLMYMNNPLSKKKAVITSSNKLRTYTTARFYTDDEILEQLVGGDK